MTQTNQTVMSAWHYLDCDQTTKDNPTCRCMQIDHHVGTYLVFKWIRGLL